MDELTVEQIEKLPAGRELDVLVEVHFFGRKGIGYYGPPTDFSHWEHNKSVRYDTEKEAQDAYRAYWMRVHADQPQGYEHPDEFEPSLCYWKDGWGPRYVEDYSTGWMDAGKVLEELHERYTNVSLHGSNGWGLTVWNHYGNGLTEDGGIELRGEYIGPINAETPEHAICLTALLSTLEK